MPHVYPAALDNRLELLSHCRAILFSSYIIAHGLVHKHQVPDTMSPHSVRGLIHDWRALCPSMQNDHPPETCRAPPASMFVSSRWDSRLGCVLHMDPT